MPKKPSQKTEVVARPENDRRQRRRWSVEEKKRIVEEAEACTERGALAALLRREGLYSQQLQKWREQLKEHGTEGLKTLRPGPKPSMDEKDREIEKLKKRNQKLEKELSLARKLVDLQKKYHEILGVALPSIEESKEP